MVEATTPEGPPPGRSAEQRASLALKLLAAFATFLVIATGGGGTDFALLRWATLGYAIAIIAVDLAVAIGLDRGAGWAVAAMRPVLWLQLLAAGYQAVVMLTHGTVPIPVEIVLLAWALRGPAATLPIPPLDRRATGLVAVTLVLVLNSAWLQPVFGPGGLLDVSQRDISPEVTVACGPAGAGSPETVVATFRWSWLRTGLAVGGDDVVVIAWDGQDADGNDLYILNDTPATGAGVSAGSVTGSGISAADFFAASHRGSWQWGIDLSLQRYAPGEISVVFRRAANHPSTGTQLLVSAIYAHDGAWRTMPRIASCDW